MPSLSRDGGHAALSKPKKRTSCCRNVFCEARTSAVSDEQLLSHLLLIFCIVTAPKKKTSWCEHCALFTRRGKAVEAVEDAQHRCLALFENLNSIYFDISSFSYCCSAAIFPATMAGKLIKSSKLRNRKRTTGMNKITHCYCKKKKTLLS